MRKTGIFPGSLPLFYHFPPSRAPRSPFFPGWRPIPRGPAGELLSLDFLRPENIRDTLHAYQLAKRCNEKRVMAQAVEWGRRGARLNAIAPGILVTPLALDEFHGPRGDFCKNMFAKCPAGRPGAADEAANAAELLVSSKGAFLSGSPLSSSTAGCFYGPLKPEA